MNVELTEKQHKRLVELIRNTENDLTENMSMFTGKDFSIEISKCNFRDINQIYNLFSLENDTLITATLLLSLIGIKGYLLLIFTEESAKRFINILLEREESEFENWNDLEISTLCETTNIFGTTFANKIGEQINSTITTTKPHFTVNYFAAVIQELVLEYAQNSDNLLIVEMKFIEKNFNLEGYFIFMPDPESLPVIFGEE